VQVEELRLAAAETLDVLVEPKDADAFTIFAQSIDRAGYARGTLAVHEGATAPVPPLDAVGYLGMADMGHGGARHAPAEPAHDAGHGAHAPAAPAHDASHGAHAQPGGSAAQTHPSSEARNPGVDMQAMTPLPRLDDPGVGLRDNGRRVLTYADLRSAVADPDGRPPQRTIELHLTGHMDRFVWSFDGVPFSGAEPIELTHGERVRFTLVNDTMMEHPIHLHGMWSDLEDESGEFQVRKHTISLPPGTRRSFRVTADAPGPWAFHCHMLYHMEAGMFRVVRVGGARGGEAAPSQPAPGSHAHG
jgi:CopA family copper-resistance protein